ncbi:hypothetical protein QDR63_09725 [Acinetobacter baumannii]|nr:hypothetical protein [Acinetobacter baumannii]MDH2526565.1 hypothetical protein [Acinetobacter baumannii]
MKNTYFGISWLRDGHSNSKKRIDWFIPLAISLIYILLNLVFLDFGRQFLFFQSKAFEKIISLFQILPGFYIAALAAVVSIQPKEKKLEDNSDQPAQRVNKLDDATDSRLQGYINGIKRNFPIRLLLTRGLAYLAITSLVLIILSTIISYLIEIKVIHYPNPIGKETVSCFSKCIMMLIDTFFIFFVS